MLIGVNIVLKINLNKVKNVNEIVNKAKSSAPNFFIINKESNSIKNIQVIESKKEE